MDTPMVHDTQRLDGVSHQFNVQDAYRPYILAMCLLARMGEGFNLRTNIVSGKVVYEVWNDMTNTAYGWSLNPHDAAQKAFHSYLKGRPEIEEFKDMAALYSFKLRQDGAIIVVDETEA